MSADRELQIWGFVQAGGRSHRFGSDKALSVLDGKTMLARTTDQVMSACGNARIVAPRGKYAGAVAEILPDRWPGEGPLGGILTALAETSARSILPAWNLIVGCDMPFLTVEWLQFLCHRASLSEAEIVFAQSSIGWEPLCACWNTRALPQLQDAFDGGVRKVTDAMKRIPGEVLDESAWKRFDTGGRLFWNMNTPEDYAEALGILESETQ